MFVYMIGRQLSVVKEVAFVGVHRTYILIQMLRPDKVIPYRLQKVLVDW